MPSHIGAFGPRLGEDFLLEVFSTIQDIPSYP